MNDCARIRHRSTSRLAVLLCSALSIFAVGACSKGRSELPAESVARTALDGALKAWRDGGKPGPLPGTDPVVQVFDTPWSQGQRLASYEILQEDTTAAERRFKVRLSLAKPKRVEEVEYYVLGLGPVMVFRDQDYERNINMENGPRLGGTGRQTGR